MSRTLDRIPLLFTLTLFLLLPPAVWSQTVVDVLPATDGAWGIDYHDGYLWVGDDLDGFLRKVDPADGSILDVLPTPYDENHISYGANHGASWDGSGFWVAGDYGKDWLYKVAIDGAFLDTLASPADAVGGLGFDGTYLLVTRYYPNDQADILKIDTATGAVVGDPIPTPGQQPFGIAYDASDATVWNGMDDNDGDPEKIWHLSYPDGAVLDDFDSPAGSPKGIAIGGGYMWLVANTIGGSGRKIYQIDLSGGGTGDIDPLPAAYDFGIISLGTPESYTQMLSNVGDGPLTITGIETGGAFSAEEVTLPVVLDPLGTLEFEVTFDPQASGHFAGILRIHSDDFDEGILDIPLEGTAVVPEPAVHVTPTALHFPDTGMGMVSALALEIENIGYQTLSITNIAASGNAFVLPAIDLPITLATFETLELAVTFEPDFPDDYAETITITSDDPARPELPVPAGGACVFKTWDPGEIIWWAQGIENVVSTQPIPDVAGDGRPGVVTESYDAGASGIPHVAYRGNSDGTGVPIWATGTSGGWGDLCLGLIDDLDDDDFPEVLRGVAWGGRSIEVRGAEDGELLWGFNTQIHDGGGWVYSVSALPDVTGDGKPEVLAGAGTDGNPGTGSRRIYCFDGARGTIIFMYIASDAFNHVIAIPDVNSDGYWDVVGGNADGYVYCVSGASEGAGTLLWSFPTGGNASFVDAIKDVNGDLVPDVIAGSWSNQVFCIDGVTGAEIWSSPISSFVLQARAMADVTGDGILDVAVCNLGNNFRVLSGADGTVHWYTYTGANVWSIYPIPDVNGDGFHDVLAGAQDNQVYCVSGASDDQVGDILWTTDLGNLVLTVRAIEDVNGNGTPDVIAGTQYLNGSGGRIFCLDGGWPIAGVDERPVAGGSSLRLLGPHPNPASESSTILFEAGPDVSGRLVLDIYDLTGRRVQSLERAAEAGLNRMIWDGREENGRPASSGVYFYRFRGLEELAGSRGRITLKR